MKENFEFNTVQKTTGKHSTTFIKNSHGNLEKNTMEIHDYLHDKGTRKKRKEKYLRNDS